MFPTAFIPQASILVSPGNTQSTPGTYGNGRSARSWKAVMTQGLPCAACATSSQGDALEAVGPDMRPFPFTVAEMWTEEKEPLDQPRTPQMRFYLQLHKQVPAMSILRHSVVLSGK